MLINTFVLKYVTTGYYKTVFYIYNNTRSPSASTEHHNYTTESCLYNVLRTQTALIRMYDGWVAVLVPFYNNISYILYFGLIIWNTQKHFM